MISPRPPAPGRRQPIIAIDGPSGVGKSTLSKLLAKELGFVNLDTGAMYRAVALAAARGGVDPDDGSALGRLAGAVVVDFARSGGSERVLLDGEDVSAAIRTPLGTIKSRLARARLRLRECLQGFWELLPASFRLESGNQRL